MPGAVWHETGPKERSEEGAPHSPFVVWNPLIQQQRESTSASCAISLRSCKVALTMSDGNYNGNLFWTRLAGGWIRQKMSFHILVKKSEQVKISHGPWVNFFVVVVLATWIKLSSLQQFGACVLSFYLETAEPSPRTPESCLGWEQTKNTPQ